VLCPIDRQPTPIDGIDVKQLTPNFALIDLLRQLMAEASDEKNSSSSTSKLGSCKVCYQAPATVFCGDCPKSICQVFCQSCADANHSGPVAGRHHRVPISEKPPNEIRCKEHQERLKLYCLGCKVVICNDCREFGSHQGHSIKHVHQISGEMKVQVQTLIESVQDDARSLEAMILQDAIHLQDVDQHAQVATRSISTFVQDLIHAAQTRGSELIAQVAQERQRRSAALQSRRKDLAIALSQLTCSIDEAQRCLSRDTIGMLSSHNTAFEHLRAAEEVAKQWNAVYQQVETTFSVALPDRASSLVENVGALRVARLPALSVSNLPLSFSEW